MATRFKTYEGDTEQWEYRFWQEGLQRRAERRYGRPSRQERAPAGARQGTDLVNENGHNDITVRIL